MSPVAPPLSPSPPAAPPPRPPVSPSSPSPTASGPWLPSAIARIEYANGLVMLDGKKALKEAEALYADMGHFGLKPIRLGWWFVVMPSLIINTVANT